MQFIFENPIFIIIIIGMITSLLKKRKATSNKELKAEQQNQEPEWKKWLDMTQNFEEPRVEPARPRQEEPNQSSKLAQEYYDLKNSSNRQSERSNLKNTFTASKQETVLKTNEVKEVEENLNVDLSPSKEKLIDGIIWAEIIGPPRAIKSHSTRRLTSRR